MKCGTKIWTWFSFRKIFQHTPHIENPFLDLLLIYVHKKCIFHCACAILLGMCRVPGSCRSGLFFWTLTESVENYGKILEHAV